LYFCASKACELSTCGCAHPANHAVRWKQNDGDACEKGLKRQYSYFCTSKLCQYSYFCTRKASMWRNMGCLRKEPPSKSCAHSRDTYRAQRLSTSGVSVCTFVQVK
jgi:hypothetical protein